MKLDGVAGEVRDLLVRKFDGRASATFKARSDLFAPLAISDRLQPNQTNLAADVHQHVGVIDWSIIGVVRVENHRLEVEVRAEPFERDFVAAVGTGGVSDSLCVIEHHGARSFEIDAVVFKTGIVDHILHSVALLQGFDNVRTSLAAPTGREHGVDRDMTAAVRRKPVVRKDGIGAVRGLVLEEMNCDARRLQFSRSRRHLGIGRLGDGGRQT